jgi:hypothetical protein
MAKITLTADEEFMYLDKLDKLQEIMPDLEIEVVSKPFLSRMAPTNIGEEFRKFLASNTKTVIPAPAYK